MKKRLLRLLTGIGVLCAFTVPAQVSGIENAEINTTITIQSNGVCWVRTETLTPRADARRFVGMMELSERMGRLQNAAGAPQPLQSRAATDEAFSARYRKVMEGMWTRLASDTRPVIERVEAGKDQVRLVWTNGFVSLAALVTEGRDLMELGGLSFERMRFEKDGSGHLQVTICNHPQDKRRSQRVVQAWKRMKVKSERRLVFPGKVLSSSLPSTDGTATWLALDWENEETLKAGQKVESMAEVVVVAELGGLRLDQPVESPRQRRGSSRQRWERSDLPVTDAGPGFSATAQSLELTTVRRFPGAPEEPPEQFRPRQKEPGLTVRAQVFPPKGKWIKEVGYPVVVNAVDDQGRVLKARNSGENEQEIQSRYSVSRSQPAPVELALELPASNARRLVELSAQVVLSTVGKWRSLSFANIRAGFTTNADLSALLPGAWLAVTNVTVLKGQITILATLSGPLGVRDIEFTDSQPAAGKIPLQALDQQTRTKDKTTTRHVRISGLGFPRSGQPLAAVLILRIPEDLRRERVQFKLTGLDLM